MGLLVAEHIKHTKQMAISNSSESSFTAYFGYSSSTY